MKDISKCIEKLPKLRPIVLLMNIVEYTMGKKNDKSMCGIKDPENSTDIEITKIGEIINEVLMDIKTDFCKLVSMQNALQINFRLTADKVMPAICELRKYCTKNFEEIDLLYAIYYGFQVSRFIIKKKKFPCIFDL